MNILLDTGPLVAYLDKRDQYHHWATQKFGKLRPPFTSCEPVISEAVYLLQSRTGNPQPLFEIIKRGDLAIQPVFNTSASQQYIAQIVVKYGDLPADFADACLVSLYENTRDARIFTLDSDFNIYRTSEGHPLPLIIPNQ
jgi:predicted nucleic acid-binding protein